MCLFFVFVFIVSDLALVFPVRSHNMYISEYPKLTYSAESDSALTNPAGSFASIKISFDHLSMPGIYKSKLIFEQYESRSIFLIFEIDYQTVSTQRRVELCPT